LSARLGGDEFTVIANHLHDTENLRKLAWRINNVITSKAYSISNNKIKISISIGISIYPKDGTDAGTIIKHANMAMYNAKQEGRNQIRFNDDKLNKLIIKRHLLEQDIHHALARQEFFLMYQPKVSLTLNKIIGCEALIRWNHANQGLLQPEQFIPLAEESNLIIDIDKWTLSEICQQNHKWSKLECFKNLTTSVNISSQLLKQADCINTIKEIISLNKIDPNKLEIEITESTLLNTDKYTLDKLHEIRSLLNKNIKIAIDDFGTGYSSLSYLANLPIDTLKIDHTFIQKLNSDNKSKKITQAIINLSHDLNLTVVAEGVETTEQFEFLKKSNCDQIQGYYIAKPLSANEFIKLVKNWSQANADT